MVKKIKLIDEPQDDAAMDTADAAATYMELAKSADWKLWEMLQTMQRLEKRMGQLVEALKEAEDK